MTRSAVLLSRGGLIAIVWLLLPPPAEAANVGQVDKLINAAFGVPPGMQRAPKNLQDGVVANERLETPKASAIRVRFADETALTMGEDAVVVVDEFVYNPMPRTGKMLVSLSRGAFRFVSGKMKKGGIVIKTPTVTIGVRGTELLIKVGADGRTDISVVQGAIQAALQAGRSITVEAFQSLAVSASGEAGAVQKGLKPTGDNFVDFGMVGGPSPRDALRNLPTSPPIRAGDIIRPNTDVGSSPHSD